MNVLSLFDGMSCGRIALDRAGIRVNKYYASEIDKYATKVSEENYPDIIRLGDVEKWKDWSIDWKNIDLVLAGSPCQGFSMVGKQLAFDDPRSKLFFIFVEILQHIKQLNPNVKFLLENVKMKKEHLDVITDNLSVDPVSVNSSLVSAQNRFRWYWTNWSFEQPADKGLCLPDILQKQEDIDRKYFCKPGRVAWLSKFGEIKEKQGYVAFNPTKAKTLTVRAEPSWNTTYIVQYPHGYNLGGVRVSAKTGSITTSGWQHNNLLIQEGFARRLTPIEYERLQTVPDNYTKSVSDTQRYKMLGNGWTVDVIVHLLKALKQEESLAGNKGNTGVEGNSIQDIQSLHYRIKG